MSDSTDMTPDEVNITISVSVKRQPDGMWRILVEGDRGGFKTTLGFGQSLPRKNMELTDFLDQNDVLLRDILSDTVRDCADRELRRTMYFPD